MSFSNVRICTSYVKALHLPCKFVVFLPIYYFRLLQCFFLTFCVFCEYCVFSDNFGDLLYKNSDERVGSQLIFLQLTLLASLFFKSNVHHLTEHK
jgi:dolichol kinase